MKLLFLMGLQILFLSIITTILADEISNGEWNYEKFGPDVWYKTFVDCGGHSQSPVNIQTACTIQQKFQPFYLSSIYTEQISFTLQNDGHTITTKPNGSILTLNGGNLIGNYTFINFHLHWGSNENVGSEHQVNGVKYTGESHFVFQNNETKQLAVLAFFMKDQRNLISEENQIVYNQGNETTNEWRRYFDSAQKLTKINESTRINLNLSLLIGNNLIDFWRYNGSLTIPPCTENVTWTIFKQPIYIFNYEFETFRDDLFFESYRGPQPLYFRQIYRSFLNETLSIIPDQNCCSNKQPQPSSKSFSFFNNSIYFHLLISFFIPKILFF